MAATILTFPPNPMVDSVDNDGDSSLTFPEVNLIFWGKAWSADPPPTPTAHTITSAIRSIVNSNYLGELAQYGVVGQPVVVSTDVASDSDPDPDNYVSNLASFIKSRIAAGKVRAPASPGFHSFYAVIVPPGVKSTERPPGEAGAHGVFLQPGGFIAAMAWIQNDGHLTTRWSAVHIFSHEFAEACASSSSVCVTTVDGKDKEIADVCTDDDDTSNGYSLHAYYSEKAKACVLPLTRPIKVVAGPVAAVSRNAHDIDLAAVGMDSLAPGFGAAYSASLDQSKRNGLWRGWWAINGGRTIMGGAITLVTRQPGLLDAFMAGMDGKVHTAAWDAGLDIFDGGWRGWWQVGDQQVFPGCPIAAVSKRPDQLDIFVAGPGGHVGWAAWDQSVANGDWQPWARVPDLEVPPGAHLCAVSRDPGRIDLFAVASDGTIATASRYTDWGDWLSIAGGKAAPGAPVTAVSRGANSLDVFVVKADGGIYTAAWDKDIDGGAWRAWRRIGGLNVNPASTVAAVDRDANTLDIFVIGKEGGVWTAAWTGGEWGSWTHVANGQATPGSAVSAVSRAPGKLDIFIVGEDLGVWNAAWDRDFAGGAWRGWWPVPN